MTLKKFDLDFSICKVQDYSMVNFETPFCFIAKTDEENSLLCQTKDIPENATNCDNGWKGFRIEGTLDFSLIGILSEISRILAEAKIGIFVVSSFNTDYIFVKSENFENALNLLQKANYDLL